MKEQIFRLCKRLKNCTLNDLVQMFEVDEAIIETALLFLEQEESISIKNGVISINDKKPQNNIQSKNLYLMRQYISAEEFDLVLRGFCLQIPQTKMEHIVSINRNCICEYYGVFRKLIYERQFKLLLKYFQENPKEGRYRMFFDKYAYFYVYENQVFVCNKLLRAKLEKSFDKKEIREFKRMYCYLARLESHNKNKDYMHYRLAEFLWRREKDFNFLYQDLKNNLIS